MEIRVLLDVVHSHAVKNTAEGITIAEDMSGMPGRFRVAIAQPK